MSVQPGATNNAANSAYFYTKEEINTAVTYAISTLGNLSTSALFTNLTVSSITVNPSGSILGAGNISTASLLATTAAISTLTSASASIAGATIAPGGPANNTVIIPQNGALRIAQAPLALGALSLTQSTIGFQQTGTGLINVIAACNISNTSSPFPGCALTNISSINGAAIGSFANNSTFNTASISSATISSINGSQITPNVGAYQFYDFTSLVPAVIPGSNNPTLISTLQTGLGAGTYMATFTLNATSISTPQNCFELQLGSIGGIAGGNSITSIVPANTFAGSPGQITFTNTTGFKSATGTIPVYYQFAASAVSLSNANAAGAVPNVFLQLFKVA